MPIRPTAAEIAAKSARNRAARHQPSSKPQERATAPLLKPERQKKAKGLPVFSEIEEQFAFQLKAHGFGAYRREYRFHLGRRWRFDFAWPASKIAVECEGGVWTNGRHTRGKGFIDDCEKYNHAAIIGWRVLRITSEHVKSGDSIEWLKALRDSD